MKQQTVMVLLTTLFAIFTSGLCYAEETEKALPVVTFSSKYYSKYVGDTGVVFYDRPVIQSEINVTLPKGLYANLWYSTSLANAGMNTNDGNEFDPTVGWCGDVAGITLDTGLTYFNIRPVGTFGRGDVWQPYIEFSKEFALNNAPHAITPYAKAEYGIPVQDNSREDKGLHVHGGLRHAWHIAAAFGLKQQADFVFDDSAFGYSRAWVYSHSLALSCTLTDWLNLELGGKVYVPLTQAENRNTQVVGNAGFRAGF